MNSARLIIDPPLNGAWNMSVDQALLQSADETGVTTLRFYGWDEPTLSLGYFQKAESRSTHPASLDCTMVRRASGGGAIMHHHDLTYSLSVPSASRWSKQNAELYDLVHKEIIEWMRKNGWPAMLHADDKTEPKGPIPTDESTPYSGGQPFVSKNAFLCFQRRTDGDIVCHRHKVVGSAQRRSKNALLQHGSLLLRKSPHAPQLAGLCELDDLAGKKGVSMDDSFDKQEFIEHMVNSLSTTMDLAFEAGELTPKEHSKARSLDSGQFGSRNWTDKR